MVVGGNVAAADPSRDQSDTGHGAALLTVVRQRRRQRRVGYRGYGIGGSEDRMRYQTRDDHVIGEPDRCGKHADKTEPHKRGAK